MTCIYLYTHIHTSIHTHTHIYTHTVSASIILASIVAVFADPIFRKVNINNINKKKRVAYAILMPDKDEDRDLLLLCIPYTFFTAIVLLVVRQMYFDYISGMTLLSILAPYRLVALIDANFAFTFFTYFNFSQLVETKHSSKKEGDGSRDSSQDVASNRASNSKSSSSSSNSGGNSGSRHWDDQNLRESEQALRQRK